MPADEVVYHPDTDGVPSKGKRDRDAVTRCLTSGKQNRSGEIKVQTKQANV